MDVMSWLRMDGGSNTPLHLAALEGSLSTVCTLIDEFKCDPNTKVFKGRIPLHHAAQYWHHQEYGFDVMVRYSGGNTPPHFAASGGSLSTVCSLIDEFRRE